jgi:uncharacterized membrane protein
MEGMSVGRRGLIRSRGGVPRWPGAVALLCIGASYLALSDYVTVVPRLWLPALMTVLVAALLTAHAGGRYRLARGISFVLLGVVTASLVLREFFLVSTLSERGASASSVLVDAVLIWIGTVVAFAVWYWEMDGGGPDERTRDAHASEDFLFPQMEQHDSKRAIGWTPSFLDYFFVSFTTSTTFGPTDTPVLSGRVKILTVIQAVLSLVVVIVLVAWAVGTL